MLYIIKSIAGKKPTYIHIFYSIFVVMLPIKYDGINGKFYFIFAAFLFCFNIKWWWKTENNETPDKTINFGINVKIEITDRLEKKSYKNVYIVHKKLTQRK